MSAMKSNLLLLLAAAIWGFAFVAQRVGMEHVGPFTFNGVRFVLGSLSLLPLIFYFQNKSQQSAKVSSKGALLPGILTGLILFTAASMQQIGLMYTTAGKAAFVTCLYIVLVPSLGIFLKQHVSTATWFSSVLAVVGLYLLCVKESFYIAYGDLLQLVGALFWSIHMLLIDYFADRVDVVRLSFFQFITCGILSMGTALGLETITFAGLNGAFIPILYGGFCSVGIAYTLQVVGQKHSPPAQAAIILSMETVFATIGGFLLLDERLGFQELVGCALMLAGMLLTQLQGVQPAARVDMAEEANGKG
ncbi:EamA-like transporter family protein [Sporomusa ovata DSM 2662]|uniref:Permease of the drug/metabolite transporter (DMT) superfamily n=1 Tax=Sporomusa ovata TaxID=2378 RepID=A0A0U1KTI6_9FIRM|nr:DMT family transporter [Sporomusa ovata]EQB26634.1 permease of the drug/metabolite transporter (DMT) superfamily [Sporomusa ovata DSM 2662]CQR70726.1 Permease of the drug/metabolite transporter (DMT) superfamily [Sporomusa ovata]